jgi:hyperosmotically inducible protein
MMHRFGMTLLDRIDRLRRRQAHRRAKERFEKRLSQRLNEAHYHGFDEQVNRSPKAEIRSNRGPNWALLTLVFFGALCFTALAVDDQRALPDNSAKNQRDRSGQTKTPGDQSNSSVDLKITQAIRQALMKDSGLTMTAKNIKIITAGGRVTLRGPVKTAEEKTKIDQLAKSAAPGARISDQLEVKGSK